jgi:LacI family transcriptional regulator
MSVSIRDVAGAASLSCETILEVLISPSSSEPEVVRFVMQTIRESGYLETFSRWKTGRRDKAVAVFSPSLESPSSIEFYKGIDRAMSALGLSTVLFNIPTRHSSAFSEEVLESLLSLETVDAVLGIDLVPSAAIIERYARGGKPLILLESVAPGAQSVLLENQQGMGIGMNYLYNKGYRTIGLMNGPSNRKEFGTIVAERLIGYLKASHRLGLQFDESLVYETANFDTDSGARAFEYYSGLPKFPQAIFCASGDMTAIGFINAARDRGVRVPDDIAILGYDDVPVASLVYPGVSTIRQRLMIAGAGALVLALEAAVNGPGDNLSIMPELIVRGTA